MHSDHSRVLLLLAGRLVSLSNPIDALSHPSLTYERFWVCSILLLLPMLSHDTLSGLPKSEQCSCEVHTGHSTTVCSHFRDLQYP